MESRKMVLMNLLAGQQWRYRHREQACGRNGKRRGLDELREEHGNLYIIICKIESQWKFTIRHRELNPVFCEVWDGVGGRREVQRGRGYMNRYF